jgi:hypothetical protein
MEPAILLSLAACFCTATASVCQRLGARNLERSAAKGGGFDPWLVFRLARQPAWLVGLTGMIAGFGFQVSALRFGPLALVRPILAIELLFAFGYLATSPAALAAEAIGLLLLAVGAFALSRSDLITAEPAVPPHAPEP